MENQNQETTKSNEKHVLVRFSQDEWNLIESAKIKYGIRTRGNVIRFLIMSRLQGGSAV